MSDYTTTIGIEVHAELNTKSKMFCGCVNDPHEHIPNRNVCPVCMAHPGTLPTVNEEAVHKLLQIGAAIGGTFATYSEFDRKNYFYPDIPKSYQISQYQYPFIVGGEIAGVAITRVHLEEDTARSVHDQGEDSLVDFNRAGVPLMEMVTEPVIHDAPTAAAFAKELQLLLRTLGVSHANMEKGEMRVEANISVSKTDALGTKVEVKNLNSFKSVEQAVIFEVKRQSELLERGGSVVQETRGWDENKSKTYTQRVKETADDYRYFPDPDIPKFDLSEISEFSNSRIAEKLPKLPAQKRESYSKLGLSDEQIDIIISDLDRDAFFTNVLSALPPEVAPRIAANYFVSDVLGLMESQSLSLASAHAEAFVALLGMVSKNEITSRVAKDLIEEVVFKGSDPRQIATQRGLLQQSSEDDLLPIVEKIVAQNETVVAEYKGGKEASIQYLVGQGMKETKGSANPKVLLELLKKHIGT